MAVSGHAGTGKKKHAIPAQQRLVPHSLFALLEVCVCDLDMTERLPPTPCVFFFFAMEGPGRTCIQRTLHNLDDQAILPYNRAVVCALPHYYRQ